MLNTAVFSVLLSFFAAGFNQSNAQTVPVSIKASGPTTFCTGGSVVLSALTTTGTSPQVPPGGSSTGVDCSCPVGYVAVGIQGRTGSWIDQFSLICQQINSSGVLFGATVLSSSNGVSTGGSPAGPYNLPAGNIMVGAAVYYINQGGSTNYLEAIGLRGQTPAYVLASSNNSTSPSNASDLSGNQTKTLLNTTYAPNGSVITGMKSFDNTYSGGVQWIYTPLAELMANYVWAPGGETTKSITVTTSNTYTLTATSGHATGSDSKTVTVNPVPPAPSSFTTSSDEVCRGDNNIHYTVPAVSGATSYTWNFTGSGETITNGTTNSVTVKFSNSASSGNMTVAAINSCGTGSSLSMPVLVSTSSPSTLGSFVLATPVCQGQTGVAYSVGTASRATSYTWSYNASGATINGNSNSVTVDFSSAATAGKFTVIPVNACGNGSSKTSNTIVINPLPAQPGTIAGSTSLCKGATNVAYNVPLVSGLSYIWSYSGAGETITNGTTRNITVSFDANATSGTLAVSAVNTCGAGSAKTVAITVNGPSISQIPTSGLIANYKLNGNADDYSTGGNQGTLQNTPTAVNDRFGVANYAYSFNSASSEYVSTSIGYTAPTDFTMSVWFNTATAGGKLIGFGSSSTGASGSYDRHIYMNDAGQLYFGVFPGSAVTINTTDSYNDGKWHMVTASLSSTNGMKLYVDGVLVTSDPSTTTAYPTTGYYIRIGYDNLSGWPSAPSNLFFNGTLDDILVYNTELTAAQVTTLYSSPDGAGSNGPVCSGSTLNLTSTGVGGATYAWTGPGSYNVQNPSFSYASNSAGTYKVVVTLTSGGCASTAYVNVTNKTSGNGQWIGGTSTAWSDPKNWCDFGIPTSVTDVVISSPATNMPTVSGGNARNLTINPSATLINTSNSVLNISGNFTNNGTFTDNGAFNTTGVVNFVGTSAQNINGATTFNNVTINSAGVTLNNAATINGILTLASGTFITNDNLSQNLYTGAISDAGLGATSGNIRFFKLIYGDRYHYLSSPIPGKSAADWSDNVSISGRLYSYNETVKDTSAKVGWTAFSGSFSAMGGYALYFPRFIYLNTIDVSGIYTHGTTSVSSGTLTNTKTTLPVVKAAADGWNLLGNPYPSTIDWDNAGVTKSNLDGFYYSYDNRLGRYAYYTTGSGVNGATRYIGSMQGFFVKVSTVGGSGSLTIAKTARVTNALTDVWRTEEAVEKKISLTVTNGSGNSDEMIVRFRDDATEDYDGAVDAPKLLNDAGVPSLFSCSPGVDYAINSLPSSLEQKTIPLQLNVEVDTMCTWTANLSGFNNNESVLLEDRLYGTTQDLTSNPVFSIQLNKGVYANRFFLQYSQPQKTVTGTTNSNSNSSGIEISAIQQNVFLLFTNENSGNANIAIFDALGKEVYEVQNANTSSGRIDINLQEVNNGVYIVKVQTPSATQSQQIVLQK